MYPADVERYKLELLNKLHAWNMTFNQPNPMADRIKVTCLINNYDPQPRK